MRHEPEVILRQLVGLPLWSIGRAADLVWFAFGNERRDVAQANGISKTVSEYSLHLQCAWRIRRKDAILVASADRFYPAGENPYADLLEFKWDIPGANQLDERVFKLLQDYGSSLPVVESAVADLTGSFRLSMSHSLFLEAFPANSISREYWRLFRPYSQAKHFVFTKEGLETE